MSSLPFQYSQRAQMFLPRDLGVAVGDAMEIRDSELEDYLSVQSSILSGLSTTVSGLSATAETQGTEAARPAGTNGASYWATDTFRLFRHDGTGWIVMAEPVENYTPTFSGTLVGGSLGGKKHRSDGWCDFEATYTMGALDVIGSVLGLPYAAALTQFNALHVDMQNTAITSIPGYSGSIAAGVSAVGTFYLDVTGVPAVAAVIGAAAPFVWGVGDVLVVSGRYRMNTRYL